MALRSTADRQAQETQGIVERAHRLGANLVRIAPVERWEEHPIQEPPFWPQSIWPWARSVIVLGIPLFPSMVATTPSMVYQELYDTSNRVLDDIAYLLANFISTELEHAAAFFPRDCYWGIRDLLSNPSAAFSHVIAAYYAGMGTIGASHNLITPEFGPRVRIVSIITDAQLTADPMLERDLCIRCGRCRTHCPAHCYENAAEGLYPMDKRACTERHVTLADAHHWPCGVCIDACPVGADRRAYRGTQPVSPQGIAHCQAFGSAPEDPLP